MNTYYGRHFAKQYIRGKPVRFGFKNWAICSSSGYMYGFDIYTGKQAGTVSEQILNGTSAQFRLFSASNGRWAKN